VQVAKGNITYTQCPKDSIHDEILKHTGTYSTQPPASTCRPYVPVKNSVSGVHEDPGTDFSGGGGILRTVGSCESDSNSNGNSNSAKGKSTAEAILHVIHGTTQKSSTVGRKGGGNALDSGPKSVIWVSVCSLHEKHGVDNQGRTLPLESLGILRGVIPVGIGLPSVIGEEDISRMGEGKVDAGSRGVAQLSCGGKRKGDDSAVIPGARIGISESDREKEKERDRDRDRGRDREGSRGTAGAGAGGFVSSSVTSLSETWRAAGFPYGEQEAGILQAHVSLAGSDRLLTYPSDKVSVNCLIQ
jgi:hypothetical protein